MFTRTIRRTLGIVAIAFLSTACAGQASALPTLTPTLLGGGGRIVFNSNRDGNPELYLMNADGSGVTRLTNNPSAERFPTWSPDGMKIAFFSNRDGVGDIYVMNADGSGVTNLTTRPITAISTGHPWGTRSSSVPTAAATSMSTS